MSQSTVGPKKISPPRFELPAEADEESMLQEAMAGVTQLKPKPKVERVNGQRSRLREAGDDFEEGRLLQDFIDGKVEFDWAFHPGYQEGGPEQRNRPLVRKLRRGGFAVQAELDMHGMTQLEALEALHGFLWDCSNRNLRCVRIVHGKGNNSQNNQGILKEKMPQWLATRRLSRIVVAYASAPPTDGGVGATYVLLKRGSPPPR